MCKNRHGLIFNPKYSIMNKFLIACWRSITVRNRAIHMYELVDV